MHPVPRRRRGPDQINERRVRFSSRRGSGVGTQAGEELADRAELAVTESRTELLIEVHDRVQEVREQVFAGGSERDQMAAPVSNVTPGRGRREVMATSTTGPGRVALVA